MFAFNGIAVLLAALLAWITYTDIKTLRIPDACNLALAALGFGAAIVTGTPTLADSLIGSLVALAVFGTVKLGYRALRQRDGLGMGDVKFIAAAGLWVGWFGLPWLTLVASVSGLIMYLSDALVWGASPGKRLPFGPHLALGLLATWLAIQYGLL